jgi:predicted deacylase
MLVELPVRGVRVGGVTVGPGEARAVAIPLSPPGRGADAKPRERSIPAWVVVGTKAGPRISVVAALRGTEACAARAAGRLAAGLDPAVLVGSVVVVPVLRPGGRLRARDGTPGPRWRFPGDASGGRAARDAFLVFSNVVVGSQALIVLGGPLRGRRGAIIARGRMADPQVKKMAVASGAVALFPEDGKSHGLLAAAAGARIRAVELSAEGSPGSAAAADSLARAASSVIEALGGLPRRAEHSPAAWGTRGGDPPLSVVRPIRVLAMADGFLEAPIPPGTAVRAAAPLGRFVPSLPGPVVTVSAPSSALVLETAPPGPIRSGGTLFVLAPTTRTRSARGGIPSGASPELADKMRVGWVEKVGLPGLGIDRLKAKIDTGARTSALHVARMRTVDTTGGPHRRPILEITVPGSGRRRLVVRAAARGFAYVRDTSGRTERRPVIDTTLKLGEIERRIAVTLTNRGDMLFPMLIGRTALGPGIVVDPARRYLLGR